VTVAKFGDNAVSGDAEKWTGLNNAELAVSSMAPSPALGPITPPHGG